MKIAAIIGEFNPFHNGHRLLVERAREAGADRVIALMSGDYVQRGAPAMTDRYTRARMALLGGVDVILHYPTRYATSSAEGFAYHAVEILNRLCCVDMLVFGSECGDIGRLQAGADILLAESEAFQRSLRENLRSGMSYPKARMAALPQLSDVLSSPNNILALEYLKAMKKSGSSMRPVTFLREGGAYLDAESLIPLASASAIRRALKTGEGTDALQQTMPEASYRALRESLGIYGLAEANDFSLLLLDRIFKFESCAALTGFADVTAEIANRILKERYSFSSFEDFANALKRKNMTLAHINRALLHLLLEIKETEGAEGYYTQILGFRREAADVISVLRKSSTVPIVMRTATDSQKLNGAQRALFDEDTGAANLYEMVRVQKCHLPPKNIFSIPMIQI